MHVIECIMAEFDIIFAGGGTAACLIAGRLAAADSSLKILVVEAGPHTLNDPAHYQPARFFDHLNPSRNTMKFIMANPEKVPPGRVVATTAGQCVGGGSSVNFSMYNRPAASEYDNWEVKYSNPGWGSKDLIPLLNKCETYEINPKAETHGSSGPIHVSNGGISGTIGRDFLDVAAAYDTERGYTEDGNDFYNVNLYTHWPKFINGTNGRRSDVAHGFIYSQSENKNLHILAGHLVRRVIIRNGRAVGVEYTPNPQVHPDAPPGDIEVYAKKQVVVSGGSWGSPAILERSGIGSAKILEKFGITQVVDLPGVGERYQDHLCLIVNFLASDESLTLDAIVQGDIDETKKWSAQWEKDGSGMLSTNGLDAGIKYRPTDAEVKAIGPAFEAKWKSYFADFPDRSVMWFGCAAMCFGALPRAPNAKYFGVGYFMNHPELLGSTHITSSHDPSAPPDFDPGNLESEADMEFHVFAYKRCREFARRMACFRGEHPDHTPSFPSHSSATMTGVAAPVHANAPDLQYTDEDDEAIKEFIQKFAIIASHALGTCSMMPRERGGVVDPRLNVYGVDGLKVADLSIAPANVGANTYSTALGIAEKAAIIIAEDLGISGI
ncbi:GMC oxidoreductase-domain-containing protein [Cristinia sonorae]|uniref:GMC oxidoreductase-domain-containing protein n=1 Tax=Cristinia sonorae TaxID=1940300 RepID=A0A8K0XMA9_9AGAR|nr:GMC oxidoreductase-domain-containing protein [Cristinia sonorae]